MDFNTADAKPVETWSPTFLPCKTPLDSYTYRQGIGYTVFEAAKNGTAILAPAYSTYRIELGEISSYPRGYKENGGIFSITTLLGHDMRERLIEGFLTVKAPDRRIPHCQSVSR